MGICVHVAVKKTALRSGAGEACYSICAILLRDRPGRGRGSHTPHIRSPRGGCRDRSEFKNRTEQNISPPTQAKVCAAGRGHRNRSLPDYRAARGEARRCRVLPGGRARSYTRPVPRAALCPGPQMRAIGRGRAAEGGTARRQPPARGSQHPALASRAAPWKARARKSATLVKARDAVLRRAPGAYIQGF